MDTGPLVALLNRRDRHHLWVRAVLDTLQPPLFTCEAVVSEACFLLSRIAGGQDAVLELLTGRVIAVDFQLINELVAVRSLIQKFATVPMALADACLVRISELDTSSVILTVDSDFRVYRRNRRQVVPTIMPDRSKGVEPCDVVVKFTASSPSPTTRRHVERRRRCGSPKIGFGSGYDRRSLRRAGVKRPCTGVGSMA